ncbi:hypothetical protein PCANB_000503 [Pneumocystis canis]|nr:hypothetical protein PCANB_000503 [Pneumocystis canis]
MKNDIFIWILLLGQWIAIFANKNETYWLIKQTEIASNASLLWGPYRPNLYMGIRSRDPKSILAGVMWTGLNNYAQIQELRHTCEQNDDIEMYGWQEFDLRTGGRHIIKDKKMDVEIEIEFAKIYTEKQAGNWGLRIKGKPKKANGKTSVFFYIASNEDEIKLDSKLEKEGIKGNVFFTSQNSKKITIEITQGPDTNVYPSFDHSISKEKHLNRTMYLSMMVPHKNIWMAKDLLLSALSKSVNNYYEKYSENIPPPSLFYTLPNIGGQGNLHFIQKIFQGPFEFNILYSSLNNSITSHQLENKIISNSKLFQKRFGKTFPFTAPFNSNKYTNFSQSLLSNLLGNIGYFYGDSVVDRSHIYGYDETFQEYNSQDFIQLEGPFSLFTATPNKSFFPRGFYWDEGFHLLLIGHWDNDLSLEIIKSWISLMDSDGWIAREQILGDEARSKVPKEFIIQYPHYANPPTMVLPILSFIEKLDQHNKSKTDYAEETIYSRYIKYPELAINFLKKHYHLFRRQYDWYRRTQQGEIEEWNRKAFSSKEGYRWRGCTFKHCLTSGLDDYPRPFPHNGELHLDLLSWIGLFTKALRQIAEKINYKKDVEEYISIENAIIKNIEDLHWSHTYNAYCDCTVDENHTSIHECHIGYVTIFPLLTGLLPASSPHLGKLLDIMYSPEHLWSPYGLRSLSTKDPYFEKDENYWRGAIWININYMALSSLYKNYINTPGLYQNKAKKIYNELRINLVNTVFREWERTHFVWEQYNQTSGIGQRTKGFTGWTSLIVNILSEKY